jgi:hypothetical protein
MAVLPQDRRGPVRPVTLLPAFPRTDVDARLYVGTVSVITFGLAFFLTATVGLGLALGTSVISDGVFAVTLVATWVAAGLGLVATRWLYAPDRMGRLARLAAVGNVSLLVLAGGCLLTEHALAPAMTALVMAAAMAWLTLRRSDAA